MLFCFIILMSGLPPLPPMQKQRRIWTNEIFNNYNKENETKAKVFTNLNQPLPYMCYDHQIENLQQKNNFVKPKKSKYI